MKNMTRAITAWARDVDVWASWVGLVIIACIACALAACAAYASALGRPAALRKPAAIATEWETCRRAGLEKPRWQVDRHFSCADARGVLTAVDPPECNTEHPSECDALIAQW